jgi:hypothetical protein
MPDKPFLAVRLLESSTGLSWPPFPIIQAANRGWTTPFLAAGRD